MIITISGKPGAGKSTVAKIIAKKLNLKHYSVGDLMGSIAKENNMSLEKLGEIARKERWVDERLDQYQIELGKKEDNFIIDSRIGFHFIPHSVKIFLDVDLKTGAERVFKDQRDDEEKKPSVQETMKSQKKRWELEGDRYKKYYGVDHSDSKNYDLYLDTSKMNANQVADHITKFIKTNIAEGVKKILKNGVM